MKTLKDTVTHQLPVILDKMYMTVNGSKTLQNVLKLDIGL